MSQPTSPLVLRLPYQSSWERRQFHQHSALRLLAGVESLGGGHYARSFRANDRPAWFEVRLLAERQVLALSLSPSACALTAGLEAWIRRMLDLDSDPAAIARHFIGDPLLGPLVATNPGLRLPVAFDPFEQAVHAIISWQVTVEAVVTITGRLIQRLDEPLGNLGYDGISHLFPTPTALAQVNLDGIDMSGKRVQTLQRFAAMIVLGELSLSPADGPGALVECLCALPGIGPWTAKYITLRTMGEVDVFPAIDLSLPKFMVWGSQDIDARNLRARAEAWRPWRVYTTIYLWHHYVAGGQHRGGRLQPDVAARAGDGPDGQTECRQGDDHQDPDGPHPGLRSAFQDIGDSLDIQD